MLASIDAELIEALGLRVCSFGLIVLASFIIINNTPSLIKVKGKIKKNKKNFEVSSLTANDVADSRTRRKPV
jgi:hypothetical protein